MPKRSKAETDIRITVASWLFATKTRDAKEIAELLNTSERNVHRWAKEELWDHVLQTLNYKGERNFRVDTRREKNYGTEKTKIVESSLNRKIFMARSFLYSAIFHEKTLNIVPSDMADSLEDAKSKLDDIIFRRKLVTHFLYAMVIELSMKIILEIECGQSAPTHHNISTLFKKLSHESQQKISDMYDAQDANIRNLISQCNGQRDSAGEIVNITLDLQSLADALKANERTVKDFKYDGQFNGKSSALCSVMWTDDLIYVLPQGIANAIIFPKVLLEYAVSLNN